ncbi:MAG: hypothetical protein R6X16_13155 [Anaerolineae bacterium]
MARRMRVLLAALCLGLLLTTGAAAEKPEQAAGGFDEWGYNYQAHLFSGPYMYASRSECIGEPWCEFVMGVDLRLKWNDAWLSSMDRDSDGELDPHYGFDSYVGSGAWLTNRISGEYELTGKVCRWDRSLKIVAIPVGAYREGDYWYAADGTEIGQSVTFTVTTGPSEVFMTVMQSYSDSCGAFSEPGYVGMDYKSPVRPGLGNR